MPCIRSSQTSDLAAITAIYAHHVLHGTGTFETEPPSLEDMATRRADVLAKGLPYLVLEDEEEKEEGKKGSGIVAGFAYANWFKPRPAYRFSAEDSIYLAPGYAGRGWGRLLLAALLAKCETAGVRKMMAIVGDSDNRASIALHQALGFSQAGTIEACGWKFGAWRDIVILQKTLGSGSLAPPAGEAFAENHFSHTLQG